ncbi:MAG: AAA family ATPase, partial [Cytophagales bacterium]|nr:AAA family ATPase [Cytophagales bacterium]
KSGYMLPRVMKNYPNHFVYSREVFVFPPWREIYTHDPQRKESFQESQEIHGYLCKTYADLGFKLIQLPKESLATRTHFVLSHLHLS